MIFTHSYQENAYDFFASFIKNILSGDDRYKNIVYPILLDVKQLVNKEKDYYSISRNGFDIIVFLADNDPSFFQKLDINNLQKDQYAHILDLITKQRQPITA